jgi:hypothetical protein
MSLQIQVTADVANAGKQIDDFSKKSRIALNSLSLVAQDLPFGFIGIQNNLPSVISSFGELTREAGGVGGAFKQLGSALIGPAGLFFAFSAVTAGVTFLIQKYGSLGAAVTALISNNAKLVQVQNELNKEMATSVGNTAAETAKIQLLIKAINDTSKPMKDRQDAYVALKKIAPEIARGIGEENTLTQKNIDLINQNAKARIEYIKLRARENAINNIINKNEEERIGLEQQYPALLTRKQKAEAAYNKVKGISFDGTKTFNAGLQTEAINLESATNALDKNAAQRRELFKINDGLIKQLTPLVDGTSKYDAATKAFTESLKKQKKVKPEKELDIAELERKGRYAALKLQEQADKNRLKYLQEQLKLEQQITKETFAQADKDMKADAEAFTKVSFLNLGKITNPIADFLKQMEEAQLLLSQTFFMPLENAFMNLFETGKFGFKSFADAVLKQIQQLVSKIIASGIISLIANIITGGLGLTGAAGGIGGVLKRVGADIFKAIGIGGPGVANPSFGGVGAGSMGMSGQVNVVLRGSDLVGALNRTNATINRVG